MWAIKNNLSQGHITILMEYVDVSAKTKEGSALNFAIRGKLNFIALKILNKMATQDLDTVFDGVTYLHLALIFSLSDVAQALILQRANIHLNNEQTGKTALHYAISIKQFEIVQLLLEKCADILALDHQKRNALYFACDTNNLAIVRLLIDHAEKKSCLFELIHQKTLSGHTAFFLAVNSHAESAYAMTTLLLEKSSELLKAEPLYLTSLMLSAYFAGNIKIFALLVNCSFNAKHISEHTYHTIKNTLHGERKWSEQELTELLQGTSLQSSASFLKQQGIFPSKETPVSMEKTNAHDKTEQPVEAHFTFLNRFHSKHLIQIENGTPNCFADIYLPELPEKDITPFKLAAHAFAPSENAHGLVKLKGHYVTQIQYGDKVETVPITHEIKISGAARIYCVKILSDQDRGAMYLGIIYDEEGLHSTKSKQLLEQQKHKIYTINLPLLEKTSIFNASH